jgi:hypothetical protein
MITLKKVEKRLLKFPDEPASQVFKELISALYHKGNFNLADIYELKYDDFELALGIIKDWRLDRFTKTKGRLTELADKREHPDFSEK